MSIEIKVEECPQCGFPVSLKEKRCKKCKAEYLVTNISYLENIGKEGVDKYINHYKNLTKADPESGEAFFALGICYLQLKLFPLATKNFEKAIDLLPEYSDAYYYYSLSLLKGRRPKTLTLKEARRIEEYLNTAAQLNDTKAKYDYFHAILKNDFYQGNGLRTEPPDYEELIFRAKAKEQETEEIDRLLDLLIIRDQHLISVIREEK